MAKQNKKNKNNSNHKNGSGHKLKLKTQNDRIKNRLKDVATGIQDGVFIYTDTLTIAEFAAKIHQPTTAIVKHFFNKGLMLNQNTVLLEEQIGELCLEFNLDFKKEVSVTHENLLENWHIEDDEKDLEPRAPIVTIMGHVDHGKTTLLDAIRNSDVIGTEHGGITQHIGAYSVNTENHKRITFIDTPGHEAFTHMRARGSSVTDIVVLVVAADDGVMPQTAEAIDHAKAADVPIIVFVNKMDKPGVNPDNVMMQLSQREITCEEWGGDVPFVKGSAKEKQGINELLDTIVLIAELHNLTANPNGFAGGVVLESHLDKALGPVATLLVQRGTLHLKDALVCGSNFGYVRNIEDEHAKKLKTAEPSRAVTVHGLNDVPNAGDRFLVFGDEKLARDVAMKRKTSEIINSRRSKEAFTLDTLSEKIKVGELKHIRIILKTDVQGTLEAIKATLSKLEVEGVKIIILSASVGSIRTSDVTLAAASNALIAGFNVRPTASVRKLAEEEHVEIRLYTVIYKLTEDIQEAAKGMLDPEEIETVLGQAEVRKLFSHSNVGTIAGCMVIDGEIKRNAKVRVLRDGVIVYDGELSNLKHIKQEIKTARSGQECGLTIKNFNDIKIDDVIEAYSIEFKKK